MNPPSTSRGAGLAPSRIVGLALVVPVVAAVGSFFSAIAVTAVVSTIVFEDSSAEGNGLGVLLIYLVAWTGVFLIASPSVAALVATRWDRGRSWIALTALYGLWVPAALASGALAAWFAYRSGLEYVGGAFGFVVAVACIATAVVLTDGSRVRTIWLAVPVVAVVFVAAVLVSEPGFRRSIYANEPPPMGLVDERELARVLPGWQVGDYEDAARDGGWPYAQVSVVTSSGAEVVVSFLPTDSTCHPVVGSCANFGQLPDGTAVWLWSDSAECGDPRQPAYVSVDVLHRDGHWSADSKNRCGNPSSPSVVELRELLGTVRLVSVAKWVDAT